VLSLGANRDALGNILAVQKCYLEVYGESGYTGCVPRDGMGSKVRGTQTVNLGTLRLYPETEWGPRSEDPRRLHYPHLFQQKLNTILKKKKKTEVD
jgi:hypothetical protein